MKILHGMVGSSGASSGEAMHGIHGKVRSGGVW